VPEDTGNGLETQYNHIKSWHIANKLHLNLYKTK